MNKIRILLIEDNRLLRDGITAMLKKQSDMYLCALLVNSENILTTMEKYRPDIVLLDLGFLNQKNLQVVKLIQQHFPQTKIIVMDLIPLQADVFEYVEAGVAGFILKEADAAEFFETIRSVYQGAKVLPLDLTGALFSQIIENAITTNGFKSSTIVKSLRITKREQQVVELISDGFTNKEIAQKLHISASTVKSHVHNILEKLTLDTRVQIAKYSHLADSH